MNKLIKRIATFIYHPVFSLYMYSCGNKNFTILPQMTINNMKRVSIGDNFYLGRNSRFLLITDYKGRKYESNIEIGENVSIGNRFTALSGATIRIGSNSLLASDILITSQNHGTDPEKYESYADNELTASPVVIGEGCWIGEKVTILPGVELGKKCIVAAGAVVNRSYPEYTMIGGVPAKAIKRYDINLHKWVSV